MIRKREKDNEKKNGGDCANSKLRSWPLSSTSARATRFSLSLVAPAGKNARTTEEMKEKNISAREFPVESAFARSQ